MDHVFPASAGLVTSLGHAACSVNDERPGQEPLAEPLTRPSVVGDTGIEPVTSSVSTLAIAQLNPRDHVKLGRGRASATSPAARVVVKQSFPRAACRRRFSRRQPVRLSRAQRHARRQARPSAHRATHPSVGLTRQSSGTPNSPARCLAPRSWMRLATSPVHPVWWLAPSPVPANRSSRSPPWKYSWNRTWFLK